MLATNGLQMLAAGRSIYLTVTFVPSVVPDIIEYVRREFRKDFGL
jgi:hypothetical protein